MALELSIDDGVTVAPAIKAKLRREVARMVKAAALAERRKDLEVALRLCDDATIRELNRDYRSKNRPTDVLAFAQREAATADFALLGDIVISVETAKRQAKHGLYAELLHLASHGLCHLLGYDHRDDEEERVMNERAAGLRKEAGRAGRVRAA
ncbi:MAG TPA: rRNA maturation RNase YbeY [Kofleriaceae bacterium]